LIIFFSLIYSIQKYLPSPALPAVVFHLIITCKRYGVPKAWLFFNFALPPLLFILSLRSNFPKGKGVSPYHICCVIGSCNNIFFTHHSSGSLRSLQILYPIAFLHQMRQFQAFQSLKYP